MKPRQLWTLGVVLGVGLAAGAVELIVHRDFGHAALAVVAGMIAATVALLGVSLLPAADRRGLVFGGFFVGAGMLSWSYTNNGKVVWSLLLIEGVLFVFWSRPWLSNLRESLRMGTAWLGISYWIIGTLGALLVLKAGMGAERLVYAGCFGLALLAVLASTRQAIRSVSLGIAVAFLFALSLLLLSGAGNLFTYVHVVPDTAWGRGFEDRFWGGRWLLYHPNSMAGIAMLVAIRVGLDRTLAVRQRFAVTVLAGFIVYTSNSRTGFIFLAGAGVVHAGLLWWRRRHEVADLPEYGSRRSTLIAAALPFVALVAVLAVSGPVQFFTQERYGSAAGVSSGRVETWKQVITDWRHDSMAEKLLGDTRDARATVYRESSGKDIKLTVDNAAFGALRKGGIVGVLAFLFGLGLLLCNVWRRRQTAPAWYIAAVLTSLPTIATTEWLQGGTGGTMWILLVAGEAALLSAPAPVAVDRTG